MQTWKHPASTPRPQPANCPLYHGLRGWGLESLLANPRLTHSTRQVYRSVFSFLPLT